MKFLVRLIRVFVPLSVLHTQLTSACSSNQGNYFDRARKSCSIAVTSLEISTPIQSVSLVFLLFVYLSQDDKNLIFIGRFFWPTMEVDTHSKTKYMLAWPMNRCSHFILYTIHRITNPYRTPVTPITMLREQRHIYRNFVEKFIGPFYLPKKGNSKIPSIQLLCFPSHYKFNRI